MAISKYRSRLFQAIHAEGSKRGLDHSALRDVCRISFQVSSMSAMSDGQLLTLYQSWTGKTLKKYGKLPRRGESGARQLVSVGELELIDAEAAKRGLDVAGKLAFVKAPAPRERCDPDARGVRACDVRTARDESKGGQVMEALIAMNICAAAVALVVWHSPKWLDEIATLLAKRAFASRRSRRGIPGRRA